MPRPLRLEYAGAVYHVTSRGNRGEPVFRAAADFEHFLSDLGEACGKTRWRVHAFCLLPDHFHLVLETPSPDLVAGMRWLLGTFTNRFNRRHGVKGHLFAGRYRAVPVAPAGPYFLAACEHVLLNPARVGCVPANQPLAAYPWSSLPVCLRPAGERPAWLATERLFAACGLAGESAEDRKAFERNLEKRRAAPEPLEWRALRRGWCYGDAAFRAALLDRLQTGAGVVRHGAPPREAQEHLGRRIVAEELARRGWSEADLASRRKTDPQKVAIAWRLRRETTLPLRWIAEALRMGSLNTLRNALLAAGRTETAPPAEASAARSPAPAAEGPPDSAPERSVRSQPAPASAPSAEPVADDFNVSWD
jgi:REP element-mobilizing transposase RayT